jgi:hypothetical protein
MSVIKTDGPKAHNDALQAAETARQIASVGATAAQLKTADIVYARAALASCKTNNNGSGTDQFVTMLRELGTGGS